jgi:hypothetical protein
MATYSTTNAPLPEARPYYQDFLARSQEVANQPYQQSPGTYTGPNPYLQQGWDATAQRAMQGSPVMGAANTQLMNTINGGFMNGNPYLDQNIASAQGDLTQAWNQVQRPQFDKAMQRSGSFGNTGIAQTAGYAADTLQKNLGRISSDMRGNAYNTERGFMQQALSMAPQFANQDYVDANALLNVGGQAQQFTQAAQNQNQNWFTEAQQFPQQQLGLLGNALGLNQGSQQTSTQPDPSKTSQIVGGALTGAQLAQMFSELFNNTKKGP